ncbi:MAG: ParB/RepB/Spo0J family partition protein [Pseudomonadota bacterium]
MAKKRALGRDLEALLGNLAKSPTVPNESPKLEGELQTIPINKIRAGRYQPRKVFSEESLQELASSIRAQGIIQPIVVRSVGSHFEIIAGERRFRAAKIAELAHVPVLVRELPDEAVVAVALIENIQREDLNPLEEAGAIQRLIDEFNMTHEQVANVLGKSRANISNLLRLLALTDDIKQLLADGKIEMGHARALLTLNREQQLRAAKSIITKGLSVRQTEQMVRLFHGRRQPIVKEFDEQLVEMQKRFTRYLGTKVQIKEGRHGQGKLIIKYKDWSQLDYFLGKLEQQSVKTDIDVSE